VKVVNPPSSLAVTKNTSGLISTFNLFTDPASPAMNQLSRVSVANRLEVTSAPSE
jgi:hypothetical protein